MLTDTQQETLAAAMNRIVPPDDFPGAWEAGAGEYLFQQFRQDLAEIVPLYQIGLDALEAEAHLASGMSFATLASSAQDALLARVENGQVQADWPLEPKRFFALLVQHTMEGFYADPGNGGNREGAAWKIIGFKVTA